MSQEPPRSGRSWSVKALMTALSQCPADLEVIVSVNEEIAPFGIYRVAIGGVTDRRADCLSGIEGEDPEDYDDGLASCWKPENRVVVLTVDTLQQLLAWKR